MQTWEEHSTEGKPKKFRKQRLKVVVESNVSKYNFDYMEILFYNMTVVKKTKLLLQHASYTIR
jgi:hypothetical protein